MENVEREIKKMLIKLAGPQLIVQWFDQPSPMFEGQTPRQLIDAGQGERVLVALQNLDREEHQLKEKLVAVVVKKPGEP